MTAGTVKVAAGGGRADIEFAWIEAGAPGLSLRAARFGADSPSGRPVGATGLPYALRASGQFALGSGPSRSLEPVLVFLHEGLGSLSMWKDFPARALQRRSACGGSFTGAPVTASRRRAREPASAGQSISCNGRRRRCCLRCSRPWTCLPVPGCSGTATAPRLRFSSRRPFPMPLPAWSRSRRIFSSKT